MSQFYDQASLVMVPSGYKAGKVYSQKPLSADGELTFTRASNATRVGPDGLLERVRTNLILQSQAFNTTWSAASSSVTANTTANPLNGAVDADTITFTGGTTQKYVIQGFSFNGNYTASVYLKAGTNQFVQFLVGSDAAVYVNFDLVNGTRSGAFGSTANMVSLGNGWYRCSMSFKSTIGTHVFISAVDSLAASRFTATSSTGTLIAFGYQLETGDIATDYIPTTTSARSTFAGITVDGTSVPNVPRLDYTGGGCGKLILEPSRTNLLFFSESFNNSTGWALFNGATVTANTDISPDGYQNADTLNFAASSTSQVYSNIGGASAAYTFSVYAKSSTGKKFRFKIATPIGDTFSSDFTTTTEWQRFTFNHTDQVFHMAIANESAGGVGSIQIFGAQMEAGSYPTSYISTQNAAVTRVADAMDKTVAGLTTISAGTFFLDMDRGLTTATDRDASTNGFFYQSGSFPSQSSIEIATDISGAFRVARRINYIFTGLYQDNSTDRYKVCVKWSGTSLKVYVNGGLQYSSASTTFDAAFQRIGYTADFQKSVNQVLIFPTEISDADAITLSTL